MCSLGRQFSDVVFKVTNPKLCAHKKAAVKNNKPIKCEDQFVAIIEITKSKICYIDNDIESIDRNERQTYYKSQNIDTIVLVLESPHTEEFDNDRCVGPAMGATGDGIKNILLGNLAKFMVINDLQNQGSYFKSSSEITEGLYKLLIINAVQYQCSLGNLEDDIMKRQRNKIFDGFFDKNAKKDFKKRLKMFNPKIIINCCTGGHYGKTDGLQKKVQEVIDSEPFFALKLIGSHPSSAFFARGFYKV